MKTRDLAYIALFAALTAVLGLVPTIPIGPVPITVQNLGLMLAGSILGARRGLLSQLLFLVLVAVGLPVLGGSGGLVCLVNLSPEPVPLPEGRVLLASADVCEGSLPVDAAVWLQA